MRWNNTCHIPTIISQYRTFSVSDRKFKNLRLFVENIEDYRTHYSFTLSGSCLKDDGSLDSSICYEPTNIKLRIRDAHTLKNEMLKRSLHYLKTIFHNIKESKIYFDRDDRNAINEKINRLFESKNKRRNITTKNKDSVAIILSRSVTGLLCFRPEQDPSEAITRAMSEAIATEIDTELMNDLVSGSISAPLSQIENSGYIYAPYRPMYTTSSILPGGGSMNHEISQRIRMGRKS